MNEKPTADDARSEKPAFDSSPDTSVPSLASTEPLPVFERIKRIYPTLSDARAKVARFIVKHWDEAAFMNAAKLGQAAGVSETVVVRLALLLGFAGYSEMQADLQSWVKQRLSYVTVMRLGAGGEQTSEMQVLSRVRRQSLDVVDKVFQLNSQDAFLRAATMILEAKHIFVMGLRATAGPTHLLYQHLSQLLNNTTLLTLGIDDLFLRLRRVDSGDLFIALTFVRYNPFTLKAIQLARARGAKVLVITDSLLAPPASYSDHVLICDVTGPSFGNTHVGTIALINSLLELVVRLDKPRVRNSLAELEETLDTYYPHPSVSRDGLGKKVSPRNGDNR